VLIAGTPVGFDAAAQPVQVRQAFGGTLLLGLEVLDNILVLGLIVVIRTFLSFSLETEIEGVAPLRRALTGGAGTIRRAAANARDSGGSPSA